MLDYVSRDATGRYRFGRDYPVAQTTLTLAACFMPICVL